MAGLVPLCVMPGRDDEALLRADVPGIHVLACYGKKDVDHRDKPGDDDFSRSVLSLMSIARRDRARRRSFASRRCPGHCLSVVAGRGDEALLRPDVPAIHVLEARMSGHSLRHARPAQVCASTSTRVITCLTHLFWKGVSCR